VPQRRNKRQSAGLDIATSHLEGYWQLESQAGQVNVNFSDFLFLVAAIWVFLGSNLA